MKLPEIIIVGSIAYSVVMDRDEWMRFEHGRKLDGAYGYTDHYGAAILLNPDIADAVIPLTLWHEALHAALEVLAGAPDFRGLGKSKDDREEAIVRRIESPTMMLIRDNPQLVKLMTKGTA